jgi:hypothetical protein
MPGMPGMPPGMPMVHNPYAAVQAQQLGRAQGALSGASTTIKLLQWGLGGLGAVLAIVGIVMLITGNGGAAIGLIITGVVLVATAFLFLPQFKGMLGSATAMVDGMAHKAQLAQTGIPASGQIVQVQQTGRLINYNPEVHAVVQVQHPQMGSYQAQTTCVVPQIAIPQIQPGAQVQVRINPTNPQDIAVVV